MIIFSCKQLHVCSLRTLLTTLLLFCYTTIDASSNQSLFDPVALQKVVIGHKGVLTHSKGFRDDNDTWLLTCSFDHTAKLWRLDDLKKKPPVPVATLKHEGEVLDSEIFRYDNQTWLLTSSNDGYARLWRLNDLKHNARPTPVAAMKHHNSAVVCSIAVEHQGDVLLVTGPNETAARIWRMSSLLRKKQEPITPVALLKHGAAITHIKKFKYRNITYLMTSSKDARAKIWHLDNVLTQTKNKPAVPVVTLKHGKAIQHGDAVPYNNETYLVTSSYDHTVKAWCTGELLALEKKQVSDPVFTLMHNSTVVHSTHFKHRSPPQTSTFPELPEHKHETWLATSSQDNAVKLWPMSKLLTTKGSVYTTPSFTLEHRLATTYSESFPYQHDTWLLTSSLDSSGRLWSMNEILAKAKPHPEPFKLLKHNYSVAHGTAFRDNNNKTWLATSSYDFTAKLWRLDNIYDAVAKLFEMNQELKANMAKMNHQLERLLEKQDIASSSSKAATYGIPTILLSLIWLSCL